MLFRHLTILGDENCELITFILYLRSSHEQSWQVFFKSYDGYFDGATKDSLNNLAAGKDITETGSGSDDLAGAARIAPLVYCYRNDERKLIESVRSQTAFTHNNQQVVDSAELFARVASKVVRGAMPVAAIKQVVDDGFSCRTVGGVNPTPINQSITHGLFDF